jgi:hypothetical protein
MNKALSNSRDEAKMYDVSTYTDKELFNILDLDTPTDRELEARIIFLIRKYSNIQNASGDQLAGFFEQIYSRFFLTDETENDGDVVEELDEGFENIQEGLSNQDITKLTTPMAKKKTNTIETTNVMRVNPAVESTSVINPGADNIGFTKSLDYANGKLNPLLQQTIKRVISIDSQYRDNKRTLSTEFTFNLSDPLKDVVSLKLYSVQIPYTWYTINNNFGSNFFIFKGDADGINNGNHDYQIDIAAGNYTPLELTNTINESIAKAKVTYTDISFGNTILSYNSNTSLITTTIDLYKQYNETSYYLNFPNTWSGVEDYDTRITTIPGFLGLTSGAYDLFHLESKYIATDTIIADTKFQINESNNYIYAYYYVGDDYDENQLGRNRIAEWKITTGLVGQYTRLTIYNALNAAISAIADLSSESGIEERLNGNGLDTSVTYFVLKLKLNRGRNSNLSGSKLQVRFPVETADNPYPVWTRQTYAQKCCFEFEPNASNVMEMNNIVSDRSPLEQSTNQIFVNSNPYILLTCNSDGYDISNNSYKINISNSTTTAYNLSTFIDEINNGITNTDNSNNLTIDNTNAQIDINNFFSVQADLTQNITTSMFKIDLSSSFLHTVMNFDSSYNLNASSGTIFTSSFVRQENYAVPQTGDLAVFSAITPGEYMSSDHRYVIKHPQNTNLTDGTTPYLSGLVRTLEQNLAQQFTGFQDTDGVNVLISTSITLLVDQFNSNRINATLRISLNKQLTETNYSIQFLEDTSYNITEAGFRMDLSGGVENLTGNYLTYSNGTFALDNTFIPTGLGVLMQMFNLTGDGTGIYDDLATTTTFSSNINATETGEYIIASDYIAFIAVRSDITIPNYGISVRYNSPSAYGYLIPSPSIRTYSTITQVKTAINAQFALFPDLSGTSLYVGDAVGATRLCVLTVKVNQRYNQNIWSAFMNVSRNMIDNSYRLDTSNNAQLSYSATNSSGSIALGVKGETAIPQTIFLATADNNTFKLIPYEEGVISVNNNITFTLPLKNDLDGTTIIYTRSRLLEEMNKLFIGTVAEGSIVSIITNKDAEERTQFRITINKEYTSKDFKLVYYDPFSFVKCFSGVSSVRNVTWDTTLGWILGYRLATVYYLSDYTSSRSATIVGDTTISTNLFNYFLLTLDDYNQNHLNDGLVTITATDTDIPLPSYANRTKFICDPVTKNLTYNSDERTNNNNLTANQLYALASTANLNKGTTQTIAGEVSSKNYGSGPFAKDVFGIIPMKLAGLQNGQSFVEFGGTLQNQERIYFGPVNIHRMSVKLLSDRGNVVDLNGANWSFSLICEQLYRPQEQNN